MMKTGVCESHVEEATLGWFEEMNVAVVAELAQARIALLPKLLSGQLQVVIMSEERADE
jgi:hypothetical protein